MVSFKKSFLERKEEEEERREVGGEVKRKNEMKKDGQS